MMMMMMMHLLRDVCRGCPARVTQMQMRVHHRLLCVHPHPRSRWGERHRLHLACLIRVQILDRAQDNPLQLSAAQLP